MTEIIFKYDGTLDKYIGDAIMAVFGAPLDMPDHAERAIRTALEMRERLEEFNAERREGPQLRIRIGINSGKVVAGEIGSINKKEYTVLGDTVNTPAAWRARWPSPMMVVIGENTYEAVQGPVRVPQPGRQASSRARSKKVDGLRGDGAAAARDVTPPGAATGGA